MADKGLLHFRCGSPFCLPVGKSGKKNKINEPDRKAVNILSDPLII